MPSPVAPPARAALLDPVALQDLADQLDSPALAMDFARDYAKMWGSRYRSLAISVGRGDIVGSIEAALSLKTSSAMVGGLRLAQLAGQLENSLKSGKVGEALPLLRQIAAGGRETLDELQFSSVVREM